MSPTREAGGLRGNIYYWKCDRPAAFYGVLRRPDATRDAELREGLREIVREAFPGPLEIEEAGGEGTHRTFLLRHAGRTYFARVEDGPERDDHLEMESRVMGAVLAAGLPVPRVVFCDVTRRRAPLAVQVITYFDVPDLNRLFRSGAFSVAPLAGEIGRSVARWQAIPVEGFGPIAKVGDDGVLRGFHATYAEYFTLHLERHLHLLRQGEFLSQQETDRVRNLIGEHQKLLEVGRPCLVHKDLALWNILGTADGVTAFIDWDDAIGGDVTDDLSLLACFHSGDFFQAAFRGYREERGLPVDFSARFWLHLLRNMIVKAVIRLGGGYFDQVAGNFLMPQGGRALREVTREKLLTACRGLQEDRPLSDF